MEKFDVDSASARDIMTPFVIMIRANASFKDAVAILHENNISAAFVNEPDSKNYYIISHTDIINFLANGGLKQENLSEFPIKSISLNSVEFLFQ